MFILNNQQTKKLEDDTAASGIPHISLMEFAGTEVASFICKKIDVTDKRVAIVCGRGNNGGDGFVAARKLLRAGAEVSVLLAMGIPTTDDASEMFNRLEGLNTEIITYEDKPEEFCEKIKYADVIVDAIFGIGFYGCVNSGLKNIFEKINSASGTVFSVDVPSGVDSDNGQVEGSCICADYTVTFTTLKPAHVIFPAVDYCGEIYTASIGVPDDILKGLHTNIRALDADYIKSLFKKRARNSNKGDFGKLLSVCGSLGMCGSAVLAAKAAVSSGTGLVKMAMPRSIYTPISSQIIEPVMTLLEENSTGTFCKESIPALLDCVDTSTSCLIGCGIGLNDEIVEVVESVLENSKIPLVVDADGLNAIAKKPEMLNKVNVPVVMTPHPGEMGRLIGKTATEVQQQRMSIASSYAVTYGVNLVLKGANTIIADPDGNIFVNLTGNPGMSKAGSGDVLAGLIASFTAQGLSAIDAACAGVYLHGAAGDIAAEKYSQHCMTPFDIIKELPDLFLEIESKK